MSSLQDSHNIKVRIHLISGVFVLFLLLSACSGKEKKGHGNFNNKPVQVMTDITSYRSSKGSVYAKITSSTVYYYTGDSARTVFPKGLKAVFYNSDLSDKALLTANYAINYQSQKELVYLKDSVRIINYNNKDTVWCKDLYWDQNTRKIWSDRLIRHHSLSGQNYGDGMVSNEDFDSLEIRNPRGIDAFSEKDSEEQ